MTPLLRLVIPLALGLSAAVINGMVVETRTASHPFVRIGREVKAGELIEGAALEQINLPGDVGDLRKSLVVYGDREVLIGTRAQRDLFPGDVLFWQDAARPDAAIPANDGEQILPVDLSGVAVETSLLFPGTFIDFWISLPPVTGAMTVSNQKAQAGSTTGGERGKFQRIGPFRLLSVGSRFGQPSSAEENDRHVPRGNERVISVAVKVRPDGQYEDASQQLLDAQAQKQIMAIALHPRSQNVAGASVAPSH